MKTETYHCDACGKKIDNGGVYAVKIVSAPCDPNSTEPLDSCAECAKPFVEATAELKGQSYQKRMGRDPNSSGSRARSSEVISS